MDTKEDLKKQIEEKMEAAEAADTTPDTPPQLAQKEPETPPQETQETPPQTPPENKEPAAEVPPANEDDVTETDPAKLKQALIKERIKHRKEREEWARNNPAREPAAEPQPQQAREPQAQDFTPEQLANVVRWKANADKVLNGYAMEGIDEAKARDIIKMSEGILAGMTSAQAMALVERASAGAFGEDSRAILAAIREELPVIEIREKAITARQQAELQQVTKWRDEVAQNIETFKKNEWPALQKADSAESKFMVDWLAENVGTPQAPGPLFGLTQRDPSKASWILARCKSDYLARNAISAEATAAKLRQTLAAKESPMGGGSPKSGGVAAKESDKIKGEIASKFNVDL